jgi:hypothetical protein
MRLLFGEWKKTVSRRFSPGPNSFAPVFRSSLQSDDQLGLRCIRLWKLRNLSTLKVLCCWSLNSQRYKELPPVFRMDSVMLLLTIFTNSLFPMSFDNSCCYCEVTQFRKSLLANGYSSGLMHGSLAHLDRFGYSPTFRISLY